MTFPPSAMLAASIDSLGDLIFIALFVVVSLVNFLYKLFKQKIEEKKAAHQPTAEEVEERRRKLAEFRKKAREIDEEAQRREIWQTQMGQRPEQNSRPAPTPPPLPSSEAPKPAPSTFKELIESMKSELMPPPPKPEARKVATPLPFPPAEPELEPEVAKRETRRTSTPLRPALPLSEQEQLAARNAGTAYMLKEAREPRANSFGRLLRDPRRYREAVMLKEILDKPVAYKWLSSAQDSD